MLGHILLFIFWFWFFETKARAVYMTNQWGCHGTRQCLRQHVQPENGTRKNGTRIRGARCRAVTNEYTVLSDTAATSIHNEWRWGWGWWGKDGGANNNNNDEPHIPKHKKSASAMVVKTKNQTNKDMWGRGNKGLAGNVRKGKRKCEANWCKCSSQSQSRSVMMRDVHRKKWCVKCS